MNIAVTDGIGLMPPAFADGLNAWSREDGTAGSATWAGQANAAIVPADQDFGACLEITKTAATTKLRYMGETPILPGTYLRVSARIKMVTGNRPSVRIAGWSGDGARAHVTASDEIGPSVTMPVPGEIIEVSAIIGTGRRDGVDMIWDSRAVVGHLGLDLTGADGGTVRIESIRVEDVTQVFLRKMLDWVDVRDFGARGDGSSNDRAAFVAADQAANGREIVVPEGVYHIGSDLTITAPVRFVGTLTMPRSARLALLGRFDFPTYAEAFGDETEGFKRGIQALLGYVDHGSFDMRGRRLDLKHPLKIHEIAPGSSGWSNRRVICNGQIKVVPGPAWTTGVNGAQASYDVNNPNMLTDVTNISAIDVGARVIGTGVGREVYVKARDVAARTLTLSQPLHGGTGRRGYSFERYRYVFDFSGLDYCARINFADIDFILGGEASGIMLPINGEMFQLRDCYITAPKDRGITSIGRACQDLFVDRCQFLSSEMQVNAEDRTSIAINVNANDTKIRENRFVRFGVFMVAAGTGHLLVGNHWFEGDSRSSGPRVPGLVLTETNCKTSITGNYIDNNVIEWTNEHSPKPDFGPNQYSFGGLALTGNTFTVQGAQPSFSWISVKPFGTGHFIQGLMVSGNVFRALYNKINRIEKVDTTYADLDYSRMRNIRFDSNTFNGVDAFVSNPVSLIHNQTTAQSTWVVDASESLPFGGRAKNLEALVKISRVTTGSGVDVIDLPWVKLEQGTGRRSANVNWSKPAKGCISIRLRMDNPD